MRKKTTDLGGNSPTTDFKPFRKSYTAPDIKVSFVDDDGNVQHKLTNGNQMSDAAYMNMWGKPKGVIVPARKKYKGKAMDSRTNWIK